jgi:hypothetical protein
MKTKLKLFAVVAATTVAVVWQSPAQSADSLINKLVQKGFLTTQEAADLRKQSEEDFNKNFDKSYRMQTGMSDWVKGLKFNGDFRARYDRIWQDTSPVASADRDRFRYRLRFGATWALGDNFEVGMRLGSGEVGSAAPSLGGSPFSANTTMNNDGSRKFIFVDLAYAKWKPTPNLFFEVGKMPGEFWFTDMVFDPDYNPEGAQERLVVPVNKKHSIGFTAGQFVIAENFNSSTINVNSDVYVFFEQVDWQAKWTERLSSRLAVGMMNFANQSSIPTSMETFINQNGSPAVGAGAQDFNPIIVRGEVTYNFDSFPGFHGKFPVTLGVEFADNPGAKGLDCTDAQAWNVGLGLGSSKEKGNWQLNYNYKEIGTAAVWHGLNDDDFGYGAKGGSNVRGHQVILAYHAAAPLIVSLRYMHGERIINAPGTSAEQDRLFFDLLWSF